MRALRPPNIAHVRIAHEDRRFDVRPAYLSLLLAMAVPFAPGDALRFLLLSLCFMFLGAGVAFLVASDIVRGR